jgi:transcriptional regulator with XRE-family HTH domain
MAAMQNSRPVRKHRTPGQREGILQDYRQSQLTQKEFATKAGISVSTLQAWLRRIPSRAASTGPAFLAVPNLLSAPPAAPAYRLQWPGGLSLEVRAGFVSGELAGLLQLLRAL